MRLWRTIREDIACGAGLLTRLPLGWLRVSGEGWSLARSVWCWPLVGALVGILSASVFLLLSAWSVPPLVAAAWSVGLQVLLTGGLHEDGLADMADGCGGGHTPEKRLTIMRDSRIGSYGALALGISLIVRVTTLAALHSLMVVPAMAATGALSRAVLPLLTFLTKPARDNGLAKQLSTLTRDQLLGALFSGFCVTVICLPAQLGLQTILAALCTMLGVRAVARKLLGGYTGDVLGATASFAECVLLTVLASAWKS